LLKATHREEYADATLSHLCCGAIIDAGAISHHLLVRFYAQSLCGAHGWAADPISWNQTASAKLFLFDESIVAMEQSMTQDFLDGMLVTMLPSMLTVAWMVWRAA